MKQCPKCHQTYTDDNLNFCLEDGEMLTGLVSEPPPARWTEDPPPTQVMNDPRSTNPTSWPQTPPPAPVGQWQPPQQQPMQQGFAQYNMPLTPNQTLAIVSLCLGIGSITIGWCCYLGVLLSPAAMVTGFIAISQIKKDPQRYTGRGLAIGGIITAASYFLILAIVIVLYGAAIFLSGVK